MIAFFARAAKATIAVVSATATAAWLSATALIASIFERPTKTVLVEGAFPPKLQPRTLYVLTEDGLPWQAALICPCGCRKTLELNLLPDEHPRWRASTAHRGRSTLFPSVDRMVGCRSHFWLRNGRIVWV